MTTTTFDTFTRQAATQVSRRRSLMTLGGAGLAAALGGPLAVEAKKNKSKKAKNKAKKKCQQQVPQCESALAQVGGNGPQLAFCCQFLGSCNATQFIQCIANN